MTCVWMIEELLMLGAEEVHLTRVKTLPLIKFRILKLFVEITPILLHKTKVALVIKMSK